MTSLDMPAKSPLLGISTIVLGSGAVEDGSANAALGLVVHSVLSVVYAWSSPFSRPGCAATG